MKEGLDLRYRQEEEEEEATTLSWSSSFASISPDNPLYQKLGESKDSSSSRLVGGTGGYLNAEAPLLELPEQDASSTEGRTNSLSDASSDENNPVMMDSNGDDAGGRTLENENESDFANINFVSSVTENFFSVASSLNTMIPHASVPVIKPECQPLTSFESDLHEGIDGEQEFDDSNYGMLPRSMVSRSQSMPSLQRSSLEELSNSVVTKATSLRSSASSSAIMSLQGHHFHTRQPSTIFEENPLTVEDDEDSSKMNSSDITSSEENELLLKQTSASSPLRRTKDSSSSTLSELNGISLRSSGLCDGDKSSNIVDSGSLMRARHTGVSANPRVERNGFDPYYRVTHFYAFVSSHLLKKHYTPLAAATWIGFWALLHVTCANYVLTPMRDAIALQVGVKHMPKLTLVSTILAFCSSVPIGWLFEAPDPCRRRLWKRMGLTRGETQGTSLALFYRCFALILLSYAAGFEAIEFLRSDEDKVVPGLQQVVSRYWWSDLHSLWTLTGQTLYIAFFLVVHLMKLHSLSLVWGVTTEAMEYEEVARKRNQMDSNKTRLQRLALVGFGGTLGGILGSGLASSMAQILKLPGLLVLAAVLLEISAELSIELGRIMQKHWEEQQLFQSSNDLASLDSSMKRSASLGSMKRVASGNSLNRVRSASELASSNTGAKPKSADDEKATQNEDTFFQRLLRGITTILKSRLLMAIFTYNALYASTTVLLSFQRAELVANRNTNTSVQQDTAFLANINMASSVAIFALQASGLGAFVAHACGSRGTLALMPMIRLAGIMALAWWHHISGGRPPNLLIFLVVDECTKIMNLAVAKPVRESLWRGLSNEARYEAKPIVDTLANRWGGGSAAFLVSFLNKTLDLFGVVPTAEGTRNVFGFPPILFLCIIISAWWAVNSADLGQIRRRIDLELKKRQ